MYRNKKFISDMMKYLKYRGDILKGGRFLSRKVTGIKIEGVTNSLKDINCYTVWVSYKDTYRRSCQVMIEIRKIDFLEWKYFNQIYK